MKQVRKLFGEGRIDALFESVHQAIDSIVLREPEESMLNVDPQGYCNALFSQYYLDKPVVHLGNTEVDKDRRTVSGRDLSYNPRRGAIDQMEVDVFKYFLPVEGDKGLLSMCPYSSFTMTGGGKREFYFEDNCVVFEFMDERHDTALIQKEYGSTTRHLEVNLAALHLDIDKFNGELISRIRTSFDRRKQEFLGAHERLVALGMPIRGAARTYAVPSPKLREKVQLSIQRTTATHNGPLTPTLLDKDYELILSTMHDAGQSLENLPAAYLGKGEEDLRDHILAVVDPNFKLGTVTGETFNRSGKTDILIKSGSGVVFVCECKMWKGEKHFGDAISQLLGYLTWRNTKVALMVFVKNLEISPVVKTVDETMKVHQNFRKVLKSASPSWNRYELHLNDDPGLPIICSVLLFHLPDKAENT